MWEYYRSVSWEAMKGMLTKGPIIISLLKGFLLFGLPTLIGTIAVKNIWTIKGFISNWHWVVVPFLVLVFLFWVWELLCINYKTVQIIRPDLIVDYKEGQQSYQQWDPNDQVMHWLLHRIRIFNNGQKTANRIWVQLDNITPEPTSRIRGLPIKMHVMGQDQPPSINEPIFELDGHAEAFVDVISLGRRGQFPGNLLFPVGAYPAYQQIYFSDNEKYKIQISVFANGTKYCEKIFSLKPEDLNSPVRHKFIEE